MTRFDSPNMTIRVCLPISVLLVITTLCASLARARELVTAETLAADAERLRAEQLEASNLKAIFNYRAAAYRWSDNGKLRPAAVALRNAGEILQLLGRSADAKQNYEEALSFSRRARDQLEEARIRNDLAYLYFLTGENDRARRNCETALTIARALHDRAIEAEALSVLGETFYATNLGRAEELQQQSLAIWRELGHQRGQAMSLAALGYYYANLGQPAKALNSCQEALALARSAKDLGVEALALIVTGNVKRKFGEKQEALTAYESARVLAERIGDKTSQAIVNGGIGAVSLEMNDLQTALEHFEKAIALFEANGQKWGAAEDKMDLGTIYHAKGDEQKALENLNGALALAREWSLRRLESITLRAIGLVYDAQGDTRAALKSFQQSLALLNVQTDQRHAAYTLNCIGKSNESLNQFDRAEHYYRRSLELSQRSSDPQSEMLSFYNLAHLARGRGNLDEAGRQIKAAIKIGETLRTNVTNQDLRTSYFATVRDSYDLYIDVLMLQHKREPSAELDREAFAVSEKARARSLLEGLNPLPQPLNLQQTQQQILTDETTLLEFALTDVRSYAWVITRNSAAAFELSPRNEIEASVKRLYDLITAHQLVTGEELGARAEREAKAEAALPAEIATLSKLLLGPLAGKLNTRRLLIVPDGALQYIPFQILLHPDSHTTLISKHEIVNQPSASTLAVLLSEIAARNTARNSIAVLADPVFEDNDPRIKRDAPNALDHSSELLAVRRALRDAGVTADGLQVPRLIASGREADEITALAPRRSLKAVGFAANRERVFSPELASYRIVHIATHGIINNERPELSGIVLSLFDQQGKSQNGFLRLRDIYNLKLPADLVVLSACSTALGKDVKGEGLIGLTRGFMHAGAAGVVASLWKVDDEATAELMKHFYTALFKKGLPPAAALRDAQLELAKYPRWQSPYYWAGFVIQGQYEPKEQFSQPSLGNIQVGVIALSGGSLLVALILILRRRRHATTNE
jgi:CHAT domain-containing protein/predicted negative regulator of RcsB-dependent stress response